MRKEHESEPAEPGQDQFEGFEGDARPFRMEGALALGLISRLKS